ncbi:MAG: hypothetical protein COA45_00960 [Zetaproteobacteria bacterium]|nr:MAG: hypothetical protein COA45_00960 [Zetaproteobacteria bacterium]
MSVDYKTAKHICNVIRRQIQGSFPDLYIHFTVHAEDKRHQTFAKDKETISGYPAAAIEHMQTPQFLNLLKKNRSCFSLISYDKQPGFLGFFESSTYLSICFINYERFQNENNLRNHAFHLAWHAISLYKNFIHQNTDEPDGDETLFTDQDNILLPKLTTKQWNHRNLEADIFSASIQALQGRDNALSTLSQQRMSDTLNATPGFIAENFPFPVCLDTLDFVFENKIAHHKKNKRPATAAAEITEEIGKAYDISSIEQWRSFSIPAQEMAWSGHNPESILGAAIYTSENTYAQSIADMLAERLNIKPETIPLSQEYNPFTAQEANERIHKRHCRQLIENILNKIHETRKNTLIMEIIEKQSMLLQKSSLTGWCSSALIQTNTYIEQSDLSENITSTLNHAKTVFQKETNSIPWDTLVHFSRALSNNRRNNLNQTIDDIISIAEENDEFSSIYHALTTVKEYKSTVEKEKKESGGSSLNISDFISPNAIKSVTTQ